MHNAGLLNSADCPIQLRSEGDVNHSPLRRQWDAQVGPRARALLKRDETVFVHQSLSTPCLDALDSVDGCMLHSADGRAYIDFHGNSVHQLGYANAAVIAAVAQQLQRLPFCPRRFTNQTTVACAERLVAAAPQPLGKVLFAPAGALVNGIALKLARLATGRHKVLALWDSFHGASLDTIAVGGEYLFRKGMEPLMPGVIHLPPPGTCHGRFGVGMDELAYADYIDYVADREGDIGALIAETVRSTDVRIPSPAYWQRIRQICDARGILLILDEIPIALGRCGRLFAFERFGIVPDMVTLGKGLGGGIIPFAAVLVDRNLGGDAQSALGHFTHEKSPLGAAAALAVLDFIEHNDILSRVRELEQRIATRLNALASTFDCVGQVRGIGMLWGVEMRAHDKQAAVTLAERVLYQALARGLSFKVSQGTVLTLVPPLTIDDETLDRAVVILQDAIAAALIE
jgi:4-aminobutyrate aminotransferase